MVREKEEKFNFKIDESDGTEKDKKLRLDGFRVSCRCLPHDDDIAGDPVCALSDLLI